MILRILNSHDLLKLEPNISAKYGLLSPSSGIFDSYNFLQTLENLNISNSVIVSKNSEFIKADKKIPLIHKSNNIMNFLI